MVNLSMTLAKRPKSSARNRRPYGGRLGGQQANIQDLQGRNGHEHGGVYRSDDAGVTWKRINSINPRPMYFSQIRVDPSDDKHLYVLGISAARSKDGGKTFTSDASRGVHSDQHALWINPNDGRHMILGSDGGVYVTHDRCAKWDHLNHMALGQFYHATVGPRRDYWVYGGLQDNGSWGAPHRNARGSGPVNEHWIRIGGGDGFVCRVDKNDPEQLYYESQNGGMGRTHLATMESGRIRPRAPRQRRADSRRGDRAAQRGRRRTAYRFNLKTPFILSHHNSKIYYCAGNHVFRSLQRGDNLKAISPDITRTKRGSATALAESPRNPDVLYVGTDDGALWGTTDGGKTWNNLFEPKGDVDLTEASANGDDANDSVTTGPKPLNKLVPGPRWVSSLEASRHDEKRVYVCLDGHRSNDDRPYVLVSENYGKTWAPLHDGLPWGSTRVVREDIRSPNVLYAGTEFAVYASIDRGKRWIKINNNLPTVAVHELAQHETSGEMLAATHGRSLWLVDVTALRQMSPEKLKADAHLFQPNSVVRWVTKHRHGVSSGARRFTGSNPGSQAAIVYSLGKRARSMRLTVQNDAGDVLRTLQGDGTKGVHRVVWDLRRELTAQDRADRERRLRERFGPDLSRFRRFLDNNRGPAAANGTYHVVLEVDGKTYRQKLEIQPDPNFPNRQPQGRGFFEEFEAELEKIK